MANTGPLEKTPLIFFAFAFVLTSFALLIDGFPDVQAFNLPDNDDYMRLQQVRDWLGGQAWSDVSQRRFITEAGGDMHFSRFPDVPMAGLIILFEPFLGERGAEIVMVTFFPILLFFPYFLATAKLSTHVGGRRAGFAAIAITPFVHASLWQFSSGRIDHHNLQILFLICALYGAVLAVEKPKWAAAAAASLVAMMVIGMETLPFVAAIALGLGVAWLTNGRQRLMLYFGAGLVALAFPLLFLEKAGGDPFAIQCDAYSPVYATAATTVGLAAMGLGLMSPRLNSVRARLLAAAGAGAIALIVSAWAYPDCLSAGPYSKIDHEALDAWFRFGVAVRSAPRVLAEGGFFHYAYVYLIPLVGVLAGVKLAFERRGGERLQLITITLAAGAGFALAVWQIRMSPFAAALAIPSMAIMLGQIRSRLKDFKPRSILRAGLIGLIVSPIPYMTASYAAAAIRGAGAKENPDDADATDLQMICLEPEHIAALRALPPGLFMNQINIGPRILVLTGHSISAGFYHRNMDAALRSVRFYDGAADVAPCELLRRPVDYVAYCPIARRMGGYDLDKQSLSEILFSGGAPDWLEEIDVEGAAPLRVFRPHFSAGIPGNCRAE